MAERRGRTAEKGLFGSYRLRLDRTVGRQQVDSGREGGRATGEERRIVVPAKRECISNWAQKRRQGRTGACLFGRHSWQRARVASLVCCLLLGNIGRKRPFRRSKTVIKWRRICANEHDYSSERRKTDDCRRRRTAFPCLSLESIGR